MAGDRRYADTDLPLRIHRRFGAHPRRGVAGAPLRHQSPCRPNPNRGRMPRLAVIDAAAVDGRRRLVLVRRDNVEHLLMIGGPHRYRGGTQYRASDARARSDAAARRGRRRRAAAACTAARCGLERWRRGKARFEGRHVRSRRTAVGRAAAARRVPLSPTNCDARRRRRRRNAASIRWLALRRSRPRLAPCRSPLSPRLARPEPNDFTAAARKRTARRSPRSAGPRPNAPPRRRLRSRRHRRRRRRSPPPTRISAQMAQRLEAALRRPAGETAAPPVPPETPAARPPRSETPRRAARAAEERL